MSARFVRELLLGAEAVRPADRREIGRYLVAVAEQRGFPLHVASLWNALYYEWDLEARGYVAAGLNPERVRPTSFGATEEAVPVGAFVRVVRGEGEVWAEVVYKEGRYPRLGDDGLVPPAVSGAHAEIAGEPPHAEVSEALILDLAAFGPDWNDPRDVARFIRRGALDVFGQVRMTGCYDEAEAELDDAAYYARYLLRHHRDGLLAEFVEPGAGDEELGALLMVSLATIAAIARETAALATFNGYFFPAAAYRAAIADGGDGPIGRDLFESVYRGIANAPRGERVAYAATSQRILEYLAGGDDGLNPDEQAALAGPGWSRLVLYANHYIAERVGRLRDGVERTYHGAAWHVRRDDAWQAGGIWRTERVDGRPPDIARIPPLMALGLGADEARRAAGQAPAPFLRPEPLAPPPPEASAVLRTWVVTLGERDIDEGTLPIPAAVEGRLRRHGEGQLRLKLGEEGRPARPFINELVRHDLVARRLVGVPWGLEVFPGVRLSCTAEDGGLVLRAYLRRLDRPAIVDGQRLEYDFDDAYFGATRRRQRMGRAELAGASSLRELIARAFRARGEELPDGARRLTTVELVAATVGLGAEPATIAILLATVGEMDVEDDGAGTLLWRPVVSRRTRMTDATLIREVATRGTVSRRWLRPRVVRMHLRRRNPHPDKVAGYAAALREYGAWGRLNATLPPGTTWVRQYEAGGRLREE